MRKVTDYIECIKRLKQPYPEENLLNFLKSFKKEFKPRTPYTDINHIFYDGDKKVKIEYVDGAFITDYELVDIFRDLLAGHPGSCVVSKKAKEYLRFVQYHKVTVQVPMKARNDDKRDYKIYLRAYGPEYKSLQAFTAKLNMDKIYKIELDEDDRFVILSVKADSVEDFETTVELVRAKIPSKNSWELDDMKTFSYRF